jgi:hypothetical protein
MISPGTAGTWNEQGVTKPTVLLHNGTYYLWYVGFDSNGKASLGFSSSTTGLNWTPSPNNPIFNACAAPSWCESYHSVDTLFHHNGSFHLWFQGVDASNDRRLGYATSTNGTVWTPENGLNPVFETGASGQWDDGKLQGAAILPTDTGFALWYSAGDGSGNVGIGHAASVDGINWSRSGNNPLFVDPAKPRGLRVFHEGPLYSIFYANLNSGVHLATSLDNVNWTAYASNPVVPVGAASSWDEGISGIAMWRAAPDTIWMWYSGGNSGSIGAARITP